MKLTTGTHENELEKNTLKLFCGTAPFHFTMFKNQYEKNTGSVSANGKTQVHSARLTKASVFEKKPQHLQQ